MAEDNAIIAGEEEEVAVPRPPIVVDAIVYIDGEKWKTHIQLSYENRNFIIRFYDINQVCYGFRAVGGDWRFTTDGNSTIFGHFNGTDYGEAAQFAVFFRNGQDQRLMQDFVREGIENCVRHQNEATAEIGLRDHDIEHHLRVPGEDEGENRDPVAAANVRRASFCGWILGDAAGRPRRQNLSYAFPTQHQIYDNDWREHFLDKLHENPRVHFTDNGNYPKETTRYPVFEKIKYYPENETLPTSAFIVPPFNGEYVPPRFFEDDVDNLI